MAWKIDFNRFVVGQQLAGLGKLNINNLVQDPFTVHEWMASELFRNQGVPAMRVGWARLFVNGVEWGIYLTIEATDDGAFVDRNFASTTAVFEGEYGEDLFVDSASSFDQDFGLTPSEGGSPVDSLTALVDTLNNASLWRLCSYGARGAIAVVALERVARRALLIRHETPAP